MFSTLAVQIYTDGSVRELNDRRGGIGVVIVEGSHIRSLAKPLGSNSEVNLVELTAIECALQELIHLGLNHRNCTLFTDSKTCTNILNNGLKSRRKNKRLKLLELLGRVNLLREHFLDLTFQWIPGADENLYHQMSHQLAGQASREDLSAWWERISRNLIWQRNGKHHDQARAFRSGRHAIDSV